MLVSKKTVYVGADIVTMSDKAPKAEAVCIADGRIECVGTREEVLGYAKAGEYDVVDFGGGTLYPGFIDTHSHMSSFSRCLNQVYCGASLGSIAAVQQALRDKAAASDDEWVIGYGYDDSGISDNRHMNRHDLDAVCADRPVMVVHISVHMGYVNTIGLEYYARMDKKEKSRGIDSEVQTNPLTLCTYPEALVELDFKAA